MKKQILLLAFCFIPLFAFSQNSTPSGSKIMEAVVAHLKSKGYRCDSVNEFKSGYFSNGFRLICNNYSYEYEIQEKDGQWHIMVVN